jgi:pimeloyl-ACP methyl ester carboxylesterase
MGISESVGNVIFVLTAYTFFPYDFFAKPITKWSVGEPETEVMTDLTDYFSIVIKGALGRYYRPRTLDKEYLNAIEDDVLLILGSKDKLVGDTNKASEYASSIKNIKVKILESGHLINSEKSSDFNETVLGYFSE